MIVQAMPHTDEASQYINFTLHLLYLPLMTYDFASSNRLEHLYERCYKNTPLHLDMSTSVCSPLTYLLRYFKFISNRGNNVF